MKKILTLLLMLLMLAGFAACDEESGSNPSADTTPVQSEQAPTEQETPAASADTPANHHTQQVTQSATVESTVTEPTEQITAEPTVEPTAEPTVEPTAEPTVEPTAEPTVEPTAEPTVEPTAEPTVEPTAEPTVEPTPTVEQDDFYEAFDDPALMYFFRETNSYNGNVYIAPNLLKYGDYVVTRWDMVDFTMDISAEDYYKALAEHFVFDEDLLTAMKQQRNNADVYTVEYQSTPSANYEMKGYIHNGDNKYTVYYMMYGEDVWEVELEYNKPNDKPNRYSSIVKVSALPDNMVEIYY